MGPLLGMAGFAVTSNDDTDWQSILAAGTAKGDIVESGLNKPKDGPNVIGNASHEVGPLHGGSLQAHQPELAQPQRASRGFVR